MNEREVLERENITTTPFLCVKYDSIDYAVCLAIYLTRRPVLRTGEIARLTPRLLAVC